jgi:putative endonuclease
LYREVPGVPPQGSLWENPSLSANQSPKSEMLLGLFSLTLLEMELYYAYILKSQKDQTYYYGSTHDLKSRIDQHNKGKSRYTKGRMPWVLHYFEEFGTRSEAFKREQFFKSIDGHRFLKEKGII